jgi:hypothetical protein
VCAPLLAMHSECNDAPGPHPVGRRVHRSMCYLRANNPGSLPVHYSSGTEAWASSATQLDEVSALAREYPGWVLPFQGADRVEPVDRWVRFNEEGKPH